MSLLVRITRPVAVFYLFSQCLLQSATAANLNLNGRWTYSDRSSGEDAFNQRYNIGYSGRTYLTQNTTINGNLRYAKRIDEGFDSDFISPSLNLDNINDIFRFSLYGSYSYRTDSRDRETEDWNWNGLWSSTWVNPLIPSLVLNYGQSGSLSHGETTGRSNFAGGRTAWSYLDWLDLFYSIDWNRKEAIQADDIESDDLSQRVGLNAGQAYFDNRLHLNLGLNYLHNKTSFSGETGDGGFALLPAIVAQASYEKTTDFLTGTLTQDGSFLISSEDPPQTLIIDPLENPLNLGVRVDFQQTEVIYLTIQNDIESFANNFSWDLYSSDNGEDWTLKQTSVPFVYNTDEQRFEFEFDSLEVRWLKLVADTSGLLPLQISELETIEVFRKVFGDDGTIAEDITRENYQGRFNLGYQLMQNMRFSYNFNYEKQESTNSQNREKIDNNASLNWSPSRYFTSRINASETRDMPDESPETIFRRYGFSVGSSPIDTLDVSFNVSMNEDYEESDLQERYFNYSLYTTAQLYRDLLASLDLGYTDVTEGNRSDFFSERLQLTARLRPTLIFTLDQQYNRNIKTGSDSHRNEITLNWRVSDIMFVNNTFWVDWGDNNETSMAYRLNVGISPNRKNRLNLVYNYIDEPDTSHLFSGSWDWLINSAFSLTLGGNYNITEDKEDFWSFNGTLRYYYSTSN